ncbi:unnamed protein product [Owenia fusiformis]|uniref:Uncharacterized protein n=1 Tax=Owenia fusiformis TaxID=6347 RepID=A0A8J1U8K5_OWEFU|nr:unnamed protein product [Owenia fusiformis]
MATYPGSIRLNSQRRYGSISASIGYRQGWPHTCVKCISIMNIILGILAIAINVSASELKDKHFLNSATGLWGGAVIIFTGVIGILASKHKNDTFIGVWLLFNAILILVSLCIIGIHIKGVIQVRSSMILNINNKNTSNNSHIDPIQGNTTSVSTEHTSAHVVGKLILNSIMAGLGIVAFILGTVSVILSGKIVCCIEKHNNTFVPKSSSCQVSGSCSSPA